MILVDFGAMSHSSRSSERSDDEERKFFEELVEKHSQECEIAEHADAIRESSSDTEDSVGPGPSPTWWSQLIQRHVKASTAQKAPKVSEDRPVRAISACSGTCPEAAVFEATCLSSVFCSSQVLAIATAL